MSDYLESSSLFFFFASTCFISLTVTAGASGYGQLVLLESVLSQSRVLSNVDLNKYIPAARLYSLPSAVETQQHQLYKLWPLRVLLCWHLLPARQQEQKDSPRSCWVFPSYVVGLFLSETEYLPDRSKMYSFAERGGLLFILCQQTIMGVRGCLSL